MSEIKALMAQARSLRDQKEVLNRQLKELNKEQNEVDGEILAYLSDNGMSNCTINGDTAIAATKEVAQITDWDAFFGYVADTKAFYMLQRRCKNNAVVESLKLDEAVPGAEVVELRDLGFRRG